MTIIVTKTVIKPKGDNTQTFPLVDDKCTVSIDVKDGSDNDSTVPKPIYHNICGISVMHFLYAAILLVLVLFSLFMCALLASDIESEKSFKGWAEIPMPQYQDVESFNDDDRFNMPMDNHMENILSQIFKEYIEIDVMNESYEKIEVPDFKGMKGRFIHDFNMNLTAIIDIETNRCFIMPLNRSVILPPKSLRDIIMKMEKGYYDIDMSVVKQNYRAVLPSIMDYSLVGKYISAQCGASPTYNLEKINREIAKRSVPGKTSSFTQYAGKSFQKITVSNIEDIEKYEQTKQ